MRHVRSRWTVWAHKDTYLKIKRNGALGLPPDDDHDPNDEQQQQHSPWCVPGVFREPLTGPLDQDHAQDDHQENYRGQGGGEQVQLQQLKMSRPWVTLLPKTSRIMKAHRISSIPQLMKYTFPPYLVNFRIPPERDPNAHQAVRHIHSWVY